MAFVSQRIPAMVSRLVKETNKIPIMNQVLENYEILTWHHVILCFESTVNNLGPEIYNQVEMENLSKSLGVVLKDFRLLDTD